MRTTLEKLVQYIGTTYSQDICNELQNRTPVTIPEPAHSAAVMARHATREQMVRTGQANIQAARETRRVQLVAAVAAGNDPDASLQKVSEFADAAIQLAELQNAIAVGDYEATVPVPMEMTESEKTQYNSEWKTCQQRNASLIKHRGQTFSLILGQCTQLLQDKLKQDADWTAVSTSYDPLEMYSLIEKTVLAQTEDQYPFATVYDQEVALYSFKQESLTNAQWYERFNTRVDVAKAIGVTRQHKGLLEYVAQKLHTAAYETLTEPQKIAVREDAEERYISYVFLRQSGAQHGNLKMDLKDGFTTGDNKFPKTRQQTLHLLDMYTKTAVQRPSPSEGQLFAQEKQKARNGKNKDDKGYTNKGQDYDKKYWKEKTCYKCGEKGHPASSHQEEEEDDKSRASTKSMKKLSKEVKSMKKAFTQLQKTQEEEDSDISDSDDEESQDGHFQIDVTRFEGGFQFTQLSAKKQISCKNAGQINGDLDPKIAKLLFSQRHGNRIKLDLREIILLDSQSTTDLFCNKRMLEYAYESKSQLNLKSNGGNLKTRKKAKMRGYDPHVWFSKSAITNIMALANVIKQYRVTYDSNELMFVVHREAHVKPNMHFRMHESGLHYYDPRKTANSQISCKYAGEQVAFVETVAENKSGLTQRQIKGAERAKLLYNTLAYPSWKDFQWVVRSNMIKDCPVTLEDTNVAFKIWGKDIAALKGKTTRKKPNPVAKDFVKVPKELMKLHKNVFLTADIFFVNKIPFFLSLSRKIYFTAATHLKSRKVADIFKAFKEIYVYYLQRNFRITVVHKDGEFEPVKPLIENIPGGPDVNLTSANEHVHDIERRIRVVKERTRAVRHSLPYRKIPILLMIHMVLKCVKMLNYFPPKGGVSDVISPKTIMSGEQLDYKKHLTLQIGQYCQVHEEENPRNSQVARTKGAIALGPSGNLQGGYKFMALDTGRKITRRSWDIIPTPDNVIARVNTLGGDQPELPIITDRHG